VRRQVRPAGLDRDKAVEVRLHVRPLAGRGSSASPP
jgi:hypothetical protein